MFLPGFRSLDNEIAYLGLSRGLLGRPCSAPCFPLGVALRRGFLVLSRQYVVLNVSFIIVVGPPRVLRRADVLPVRRVRAGWLAVAVPSAEEGTATGDSSPD